MIRTRPYESADRNAVVDLSLRAWKPVFESFEEVLGSQLFARFYPNWRAQQSEAVAEALGANPTWVALVDAEVAGFVNVVFDDAEKSGEIFMIAVEPDLQRRGVASALTELALSEMKRRGATLATVATGGDPGHAPARKAYEAAGFVPFPQVLYAKLLEPPEG